MRTIFLGYDFAPDTHSAPRPQATHKVAVLYVFTVMREPLMNLSQRIAIAFTLLIAVTTPVSLANEALEAEVKTVYDSKLKELFLYFHQNQLL